MNKSIVLKILNKIGIALTALTAIGFASTNSVKAASVTTLLQDSFDQENSTALNYDHFANWNVIKGSVDLIGSVGFYDFLPANGLYVDLDGSTGQAGTIESKKTFNFQAGDTVNLSFQLAGNQRDNVTDSVTVSLGNLFSETFSLPRSQAFTNFTRSFTVASITNATLDFKGIGKDNIGLLLDNVTLTKSVPEPGSIMGLLAFGAFGATSLRKRKQPTFRN
ncbi:PEP-CTERM sorting domain-containing protein [Nostoc sp. XA010]|uniref:PEP-CTERM sorting domain-containing protein n=1 Tax=Nostoc sp. XA010 TaxID=2780407 RepID=UPI001E62CA39|nr:PEP-CTERM sorting domain-containing protein [Nostoc sp. XA010]MCC5658295.1 PEP-CTERM sorting domain-containing protein [Nostoc sp. XA010]